MKRKWFINILLFVKYKKSFKLVFDKQTFYLKRFSMALSYGESHQKDYLTCEGRFWDWNKVKDSVFNVSENNI